MENDNNNRRTKSPGNPEDIVRDLMKRVERFTQNSGFKGSFFTLAAGAIFLVIVVSSSFYTVQPDEEAVIIRLGKYSGTYPPGFHFKIPFGIDRLEKLKTKLVHQAEFGFRTSNSSLTSRTQYSKSNLKNESSMLTGDLNVADVEWVVQYQIADPFKYLFAASEPIRNLRDVSESILRRVVGDRTVTEILTIGRLQMAVDAKKLMQEILDKYDIGIRIVAIKLQDINPPETVKPSFNEVVAAKQEQEQLINRAEEAYNKVIPEARGKAEKAISMAKGYSAALVNRATGDAEKFNAVLVEYKLAPGVTKDRLYLEAMEAIFNRFERVTIVDSKVKGILPVFTKQPEAQRESLTLGSTK